MKWTPEELANEVLLADMGELAGLVTHEFNDILNTILLHIALIEQGAPQGSRRDVAAIREQSKAIAALIKQYQRYRQGQLPAERPVDLNGIVADVVQSLSEKARVLLDLEPALPAVLGNIPDLHRLVTFLLRNALAASRTCAATRDANVTLRTKLADGKALLRVEDPGPGVAPEALSQFFDVYFLGREGTNSLELAACKRLVRRLQGEVHGENGVEGGFTVIAKLQLAAR